MLNPSHLKYSLLFIIYFTKTNQKKMKHLLLTTLTCLLSLSAVMAQVSITFEVNTQALGTVDPGGLFIAGGTGFGAPGDNALTDPDTDGIYTITVQRDPGFSSFYTLTNGNCPDYSCKENLAGKPCGDPMNFNDRFLPAVSADTTVRLCFGTCDSDGSCTIVTDSVNITFEVNTSALAMVDAGGIFLAGGGNFGNPGDNPMIDPDADGIYTITVRQPMGFASNYTFTNGNCPDFTCKENIEGLPCADANSFNDRFLPQVMSDTTIQACFGNCASDGTCNAVSIRDQGIDQTLFDLQPSLADKFTQLVFGEHALSLAKEIQVISLTGRVIQATTSTHQATYRINTAGYPAGLYYVKVQAQGKTFTRKFAVQR
jgi:hypothetical protein